MVRQSSKESARLCHYELLQSGPGILPAARRRGVLAHRRAPRGLVGCRILASAEPFIYRGYNACGFLRACSRTSAGSNRSRSSNQPDSMTLIRVNPGRICSKSVQPGDFSENLHGFPHCREPRHDIDSRHGLRGRVLIEKFTRIRILTS